MALTPTLYTFDVALADVDRGVYADLSFRVACHPSETLDHLLVRVLAFCLEQAPGIAFGSDLSAADQPALCVRDLTGRITTWIDVGLPDPERVHKAMKAAGRVAIYTHRDPQVLKRQLEKRRIHRAAELLIVAFERSWLAGLAEILARRNRWEVTVSGGQIIVIAGAHTFIGPAIEHRLEA